MIFLNCNILPIKIVLLIEEAKGGVKLESSSLYTNKKIIDIYNRNVNMIYKICLMYLKNIPDTEDAVQDIILKLINGNHKFKNLEHEKAWLIVTSQNYCKNILKYWWRKKRTDINNIPIE